jgi:hypothetical protein
VPARQDWPEGLRGCGRNNIDARVAEEAISAAMVDRLGDPRRAERVAAHLAQVRAERARIGGEIARWEATADELAEKTATWGVARGDIPTQRAMIKRAFPRLTLARPDSTATTAPNVSTGTDSPIDTPSRAFRLAYNGQ